jgi:hypothetical protein
MAVEFCVHKMGALSRHVKSLQELNLAFCYALDTVPWTMPADLKLFDLSYLRHISTIAEQLVDLAEQMPRPQLQVKLIGWEQLLGEQLVLERLRWKQPLEQLHQQQQELQGEQLLWLMKGQMLAAMG